MALFGLIFFTLLTYTNGQSGLGASLESSQLGLGIARGSSRPQVFAPGFQSSPNLGSASGMLGQPGMMQPGGMGASAMLGQPGMMQPGGMGGMGAMGSPMGGMGAMGSPMGGMGAMGSPMGASMGQSMGSSAWSGGQAAGAGGYGGGESYGSGAGYTGGGPNAGYGGYPGRGGFSGYWEPGVKPVPLAMQGWGLFIPRPPVEITPPTTRITTRAPTPNATVAPGPAPVPAPAPAPAPAPVPAPAPASVGYYPGYGNYMSYNAATTVRPTTPTTTTTTTTTARRTTMPSHSGYGGSGMASGMGTGGASGNRVQVEDPFAINQKLSTNEQSFILGPVAGNVNQPFIQSPMRFPPADEKVSLATQEEAGVTACIPKEDTKANGICVDEAQLGDVCIDMIIGQDDSCLRSQWCCYKD